jgi:hypothetical protein
VSLHEAAFGRPAMGDEEASPRPPNGTASTVPGILRVIRVLVEQINCVAGLKVGYVVPETFPDRDPLDGFA